MAATISKTNDPSKDVPVENIAPEYAKLNLDGLKEVADKYNIPHHPTIGEKALAVKITEVMETVQKPTNDLERKAILRREANIQLRVKVTSLNPAQKALQGIPYEVSNNSIGTVKKFIAFNKPWHIPQCFLKSLRGKVFAQFVTETDPLTKEEIVSTVEAQAYNIEILPDIPQEKLDAIAAAQVGKL